MKILSYKPTITRKDLESVLDCLIKDELVTGNPVKTFENSLSGFLNSKYALATNSLTSAYHLIFKALNIGDDDEVIMPSYFWQAPLSALLLTGGKAVLVDNEENSLFPSIDMIKAKITEKTKAIVTGHTFGFHFDTNALKDAAIPVIEDISHAIGTEAEETPIGQGGTYTVLSLEPAMIITTGNGGMVFTNNSKSYAAMRDLRGNSNQHINLDYTMTDFQGAMGITQFMKLKNLLKRRKEIAKIYYDALKITEHQTLFPYNEDFAYQSFPVLFNAPKDKVEKYWKKNGIEIIHPIETALHSHLDIRGLDFPISDRLCKKLFALPIYPTLSKKDFEKIAKSLSSFI